MTDYKQLCADLVNELHGYKVAHPNHDTDLIDHARAALAEPEPEEPTYEELCDLMYEFTISTGHGSRLDEIGFARALLARWGNRSAPQPIPVSERLPGPEDCDAEGRFWWWYPPALETYGCWVYEDYAINRAYEEWPSAWLPANALPLPDAEDIHDQ